MALLCFLMPLFSRKTTNEFEEEETYKGESMLQHFVSLEGKNAAKEQVSSHEFAYRKLKQLFAPFVLRRRKKDVLSQILPPKTYEVEMVTLDEKARSQYSSIINAHVRAKKSKAVRFSDHLFTNLRKAAHHPLLLRHRHTSKSEIGHLSECFRQFGAFPGDGATKERVEQELEGFSDFEIHLTAHELLDQNPLRSDQLARYILSNADLFASAKFVRLREILPKLTNAGHRVLIFSGWTRCLDLLG
jgi:SWI/SNF-related matrix-associated actin-dependent regulator of chromatin subfamily A containing DEAD/H box 1